MSNYTPTTAEVSAAYIQWSEGWSAGGYTSEQEASEEFNRWLSGRIRKAEAEGLKKVIEALKEDPQTRDPLRLNSDWLQKLTQQLTGEP